MSRVSKDKQREERQIAEEAQLAALMEAVKQEAENVAARLTHRNTTAASTLERQQYTTEYNALESAFSTIQQAAPRAESWAASRAFTTHQEPPTFGLVSDFPGGACGPSSSRDNQSLMYAADQGPTSRLRRDTSMTQLQQTGAEVTESLVHDLMNRFASMMTEQPEINKQFEDKQTHLMQTRMEALEMRMNQKMEALEKQMNRKMEAQEKEMKQTMEAQEKQMNEELRTQHTDLLNMNEGLRTQHNELQDYHQATQVQNAIKQEEYREDLANLNYKLLYLASNLKKLKEELETQKETQQTLVRMEVFSKALTGTIAQVETLIENSRKSDIQSPVTPDNAILAVISAAIEEVNKSVQCASDFANAADASSKTAADAAKEANDAATTAKTSTLEATAVAKTTFSAHESAVNSATWAEKSAVSAMESATTAAAAAADVVVVTAIAAVDAAVAAGVVTVTTAAAAAVTAAATGGVATATAAEDATGSGLGDGIKGEGEGGGDGSKGGGGDGGKDEGGDGGKGKDESGDTFEEWYDQLSYDNRFLYGRIKPDFITTDDIQSNNGEYWRLLESPKYTRVKEANSMLYQQAVAEKQAVAKKQAVPKRPMKKGGSGK